MLCPKDMNQHKIVSEEDQETIAKVQNLISLYLDLNPRKDKDLSDYRFSFSTRIAKFCENGESVGKKK